MKRCALLALLGWLVIVPWTVSAQDPDLPPVLRPADVFTDMVAVVETLPVFEYENETRLAFYFDPSLLTWTAYPYPDALTDIKGVVARVDGTFIVGPDVTDGIQWTLRQDVKWLFDPAAMGFVPPLMACGRVRDLPGKGEWRVVQQPEDMRYYLCQTATDERLGPLPEEIAFGFTAPSSELAWTSPSGEWIVFQAGGPYDWQLFAYEIETHRAHALGTGAQPVVDAWIEGWIEDTQIVIYTQFGDGGNPLLPTLYRANITQPDSLTMLSSHQSDRPSYRSDRQYLEWVPPANTAAPDCRLHVLDLRSGELTIYPPVPDVCTVGHPIPGRGEARLTTQSTQAAGGLRRFDPATGEATRLLEGEIALWDVTPDGRYAVITGTAPQSAECPTYTGLFDLEANALRYQRCKSTPLNPSPSETLVSFLGPDLFLFGRATGSEALVVSVQPGTVTESVLPNIGFGDSQAARIPIWTDLPGDSWGVTLYNAATGAQMPVIQSLVWESVFVEIAWRGEGLLWVQIADASRTVVSPTFDPFVIGEWVIRVP